MILSGGWILAIMTALFVAAAMIAHLPIGLSLAVSAVAGAWLGGIDEPLRQLLEGSMGYLDTLLVIGFAMAFMTVLRDSGSLGRLANWVLRISGSNPWLLLPLTAFLVMLPGTVTGSSTAAILTAGALVAPSLLRVGLSPARTGALIAMSGIYGMLAPPVNLPAMIIGGGVDLPYVGFEGYLLAATLPLAALTAWYVGWPLLRRHDGRAALAEATDPGNTGAAYRELKGDASADASADARAKTGWPDVAPWVLVLILIAGPRLWPAWFPDLGLPLVFFVAAVAATVLFWGQFRLDQTLRAALDLSLPVLAILVGVGMFLQVMTATGGRGALVVSILELPAAALYVSMALAIPLFGAVSAFGSASVLGIPFLLALLGRNDIATAAGLSLLAGLGDLVPPTALAGIFAAQVVGERHYGPTLRLCLVPAFALALVGLVLAIWA